jgi:hypothetical protein
LLFKLNQQEVVMAHNPMKYQKRTSKGQGRGSFKRNRTGSKVLKPLSMMMLKLFCGE